MVFIFLTIISYVIFLNTKLKPTSKFPTIILLIAYAIVFSMRTMQVADTEPYYDTYTGIIDPNMEIGFLYLNLLFRGWGVSFNQFLLIIAVFDLLLWYEFTRKTLKQNNLLIALILFMSSMGMLYYGIVLRSGMASSIMMIPISYLMLSYEKGEQSLQGLNSIWSTLKKILLFVLCLFVGGLFHQSVYIVIVALLLYYIPLGRKSQYILLFLALFVSSIPSVPQYISSIVQPILENLGLRMSDRFNREIVHGLSLYQVSNVIIGFLYIALSKYMKITTHQKQYQFILNLYVVGVFLSGAFSFLTAGARIGHLLIFYEFFLPALLLQDATDKKERRRILLTILFIVVLNFARNLYSTPSLIHYIG